jgi:hypothetical protein
MYVWKWVIDKNPNLRWINAYGDKSLISENNVEEMPLFL